MQNKVLLFASIVVLVFAACAIVSFENDVFTGHWELSVGDTDERLPVGHDFLQYGDSANALDVTIAENFKYYHGHLSRAELETAPEAGSWIIGLDNTIKVSPNDLRPFDPIRAFLTDGSFTFTYTSTNTSRLTLAAYVFRKIRELPALDQPPAPPTGGGDDPVSGGGGDPFAPTLTPTGEGLSLTRTVKVDGARAATVPVDHSDSFGYSVAFAGDLDGSGGTTLVVGAQRDLYFGRRAGAIYLLPYDAAGNLGYVKKIGYIVDSTNGSFYTKNSYAPSIDVHDKFGFSVANAGDLDGTGGTVLAVGAPDDDDGGRNTGAIYLLHFNATGSLTAIPTKIGAGTSNGPILAVDDGFGGSIANAGDLYGNGGTVLAVGAPGSMGTAEPGAIYLLSFDAAGAFTGTVKIDRDTVNGPALFNLDEFGRSIANAGDLDGGGGTVLAVGAEGTGLNHNGAIHLLSFDAAGVLTATTKIGSGTPNGPGSLADADFFGQSIANVGDLDGGGGTVLAVGAPGDDRNGINNGVVYFLSFNDSGSLMGTTQVAKGTANGPALADSDRFGKSIANVGDLDGSGGRVLAVGGNSFSHLSQRNATRAFHLLYYK